VNTSQSSTQEAETPNSKLKALAWGTILIVSVPQIIYRLLVPGVPGEPYNPIWLAWAQVAILTILWAVTWVWPAVTPLRGFILAVLAISVGTFFITPSIDRSTAWSNWIQQSSWWVWFVAGRLMVHLVQIALMALTLIGSGI
jgi:hypothetical protein